MSGFRKFGTGADNRVQVDGEDEQGLSKEALKGEPKWTDKDAEDLRKENEE